MCDAPPSIAVKVPVGGVAWPEPLKPQQATVPLARSPQLWPLPAAMVVKVPAGGVVAWPPLLKPQQVAVPSVRSPHVWWSPAARLPLIASGLTVAVD